MTSLCNRMIKRRDFQNEMWSSWLMPLHVHDWWCTIDFQININACQHTWRICRMHVHIHLQCAPVYASWLGTLLASLALEPPWHGWWWYHIVSPVVMVISQLMLKFRLDKVYASNVLHRLNSAIASPTCWLAHMLLTDSSQCMPASINLACIQ